MSTSTTVQFIVPSKGNARSWEQLKGVIGTISLFEMWFFGGIKKEKGEPLSYSFIEIQGASVKSTDVTLDPAAMCSSDWVDVDMESLEGALEDRSFYCVVRAVNAILMYRACGMSLLSPEFLAAIQDGGFWDSTTPRQLVMMLDFWGHYAPPDVEGLNAACNWFSEKKPFEGFEGNWWTERDVLDMLWLPQDAPFQAFLEAHKTDTNDEGDILLYDTLWVKYSDDHVYFPTFSREGRFRYTWKGEGKLGGEHEWVKGDSHMLGNILFWWCISEPLEKWISALLNRDATNLVAPNRVYGHPSPLNKASDRCTVGHLTLRLDGGGSYPICVEVDNDTDAYAAAAAAKYAFQEGLAVLFQHQLESLRVGKAAAGLGKSTIKMVLPLKAPDGSTKMAKVRLSLGQFAVDKSTKLFNRDSLEFRCQPILEAIRGAVDVEQTQMEDDLVSVFQALADEALS